MNNQILVTISAPFLVIRGRRASGPNRGQPLQPAAQLPLPSSVAVQEGKEEQCESVSVLIHVFLFIHEY